MKYRSTESKPFQYLSSLNPSIWILTLAGLLAMIFKLQIIYPIQYVGHADASGYAEMADSLLKGRGLEVDYVSWYFFQYDPEIVRPEDHWPPLYSFLIVPFFALLGKTAFAAKIPSVLISCLFFPWVVYALTRLMTSVHANRSGCWVSLAAGLHILVYPELFRHSLYCLSDVTFAFTVCLTVLFLLQGLTRPQSQLLPFCWMGIAMGLAYYAKGTGLVLIPAYVTAYVISYLLASQKPDPRPFIVGISIAFLVITPWWIRNLIHFGSPTFSTQQFAAGYIGYISWEEGTYTPYFGQDLPSFATKVKRWGISHVVKKTTEFFQIYLRWAFIDIRSRTGKFPIDRYETYLIGISAILGLIMFALSVLVKIYFSVLDYMTVQSINRRCQPIFSQLKTVLQASYHLGNDLWRLVGPWYCSPSYLIWLVLLVFFGFHSLCWEPINRLVFPIIPLILATGWSSLHLLFGLFFQSYYFGSVLRKMAIFILALAVFWQGGQEIHRISQKGRYPYKESGQAWMAAGKWLKVNEPNSITMTRNPWELHFYSEAKAIQIPLADLETIIDTAQYFGATHLIPEKRRPSLKKWLSGEVPGLELVYDEGLKIYQINLDRSTKETLN